MPWKNVHHLWLLFPAFSKNDEHFLRPFGILKIIVGTFETISNSPQMLSRLFGHLKYFIEFKCPNSNTYDLIQKSINDLEKCVSFLAEVLDQSRNDEHF